MSEARYNRDDQNAVTLAQQRVADAVMPLLSGAESREQALLIAMSAMTASLGLAVGAFAAVHDLDLASVDELALAGEVLGMMREVRTQ